MSFNKFLSIILITFTVLLCNINLCLGNNTQNTSIAINPMRLPDIDPMINPATDNWLTREVARQVNKDNVNELTQSDFMKIISITKEKEEIDTIPSEIGNLYNLSVLILSYNNIESIPDVLGNLIKLDTLRLDYNNIREIPDSFYNLNQLENLYLNYNNISSISNKIDNLKNLTYLEFGHNNLDYIPPEIGALKNLDFLYLQNNKLHSIPPEIGNLTKLSTLYLHSNCLTFIPKELLELKYTPINIHNQQVVLPQIINISNNITIDNPLECFGEIIIPSTINNEGKYNNEDNTICWDIDNSISEVSFKFNKRLDLPNFPTNYYFFDGVVTIPIISDEDAIALNAEIQKAKDLLESDDVTSDKLIKSISGLSNAITVYEKSHSNK